MSETNPESNFVVVEGVFEPLSTKCGQLLALKRNGKASPEDPFVPRELVRRFKLREGCFVSARVMYEKRFSNPRVFYIQSIDGVAAEVRKKYHNFDSLTTIVPNKRLCLETADGSMSNRIIDLFCPIGKGQRGLIVAPPRTGKTTLLQNIAKGIKENHPECHIIVLLVDERPEEVTDFKRLLDVELYASSNDEKTESHIQIADRAIERAKRLVEVGKDVVLLLDSITRLSRAHNVVATSNRTMSGGLDIRALEKPRQLFAAARNTEEAGSLTILASALIETGSRMDDMIFQEFKGTGNMEIVLDRKAAEMRLWPAIDLSKSGTRREELLLAPEVLDKVHFFRRGLASLRGEDSIEALLNRMGKTKNNKEFLSLLSC